MKKYVFEKKNAAGFTEKWCFLLGVEAERYVTIWTINKNLHVPISFHKCVIRAEVAVARARSRLV